MSKFKCITSFIAVILSACATEGGVVPPAPAGQFFMAGPVSADADVLSIQWQYGIKFSIDTADISEVRLACDPIPGTTFTVSGASLGIKPNGSAMWRGPILPVSSDSTPWLYARGTTAATCTAVVVRPGKPDGIVQAPVSFAAATKAATLQQLMMAYDYNSKLKKK